MLKLKIDKLEDVAEPLRAFYKEHKSTDADGIETKVFILQVEGAVDAERLKEVQKNVSKFRSTNIKTARLLEVVATALGIEINKDELPLPDDLAAQIKEKLEEDAKAGKGGKAELEALVNKRVEAIKKDFETKLKAAEDNGTKLSNRLQKIEVENAVLAEATKRGMAEGAARDIVRRAQEVFKYKETKVVAEDEAGEQVFSAKDPTQPLTISEWVETLSTSKDGAHLFKGNSGAGGSGSSGGAGRNGHGNTNPWKKETRNVTLQMQLIRSDLPTARRLAAEAGVKLPDNLTVGAGR